MDLVNGLGEVYRQDFHDNSWHKASLKRGILGPMAASQAPDDNWLEELEGTAALLIMDDTIAIPAPPLKQMLATPPSSPTPAGEIERLTQLATDHLTQKHLGDSLLYSGCLHQEFVLIATAFISHSFSR